jgi:hypothetical protein
MKKKNAYNPGGYELTLGTDHYFEFIPEFRYETHYETDEVGNTRVVHTSIKKPRKVRKK